MTKNNVRKALSYGKMLVGAKYDPWINGRNTRLTEAPFYALNASALPPRRIKTQGCICAGLINLMRRHVGLPVPDAEKKDYKYAGGTESWFRYLKKKKLLEPFDINKKYPAGTLLLRNYRDFNDQGHLAVIFKAHKESVLYASLLHCYTRDARTRKPRQSPGVIVDKAVGTSHFWRPEGFYTHACLPQYWLK